MVASALGGGLPNVDKRDSGGKLKRFNLRARAGWMTVENFSESQSVDTLAVTKGGEREKRERKANLQDR